jgi:pimeloyl-ACP methyl ester carboxylesterase
VARARDHAGNGDRADAAHDGMPVIRVPKGGHVAPVEQPEALAGELRAFLSAL